MRSYSSGGTPWPTPTTAWASASTSRSSSRVRASRRIRPAGRRCGRRPVASTVTRLQLRQHPGAHGHELRGGGRGDRRDQRTAERRLPGDEPFTVELERDRVTGEAGAERGGDAGRDLAAPDRPRREDGPRRRPRAPIATTAAATSSSTSIPVDAHDLVGAPAAELIGIGRVVAGRSRGDRDHPTGEACRRAEQLAGEQVPALFDEHRDQPIRRAGGEGAGTEPVSRSSSSRVVERPSLGEDLDRAADLFVERGVGDAVAQPDVVEDPHPADRGRAPGLAPRSGSEIVGAELPDRRSRNRGAPLRIHLARIDESFGRRQQGGKADLGLEPAVVELAARACTRPSGSIARCRTPVRNGRSSSCASSGGTWPVSASTELRPASTRSNGPVASMVAASARAVASVSEPANAASVTSTPSIATSRSSPHATASRTASSAAGGPSVITVTDPPCVSRERHRLGNGSTAVGVHLQLETLAHEATVGSELHRLELRDLLDQGRDPKGWHRA